MARADYWNHNVHYQPVILGAVPPGCRTALDGAIYGKGESGAPILDPEMSWREVRAAAARLLPGVRYRRHLLFRYSLLWRKPG